MEFDNKAGHLGNMVGLVKFDLGSPDKPVAATLRFGNGRIGGEAVFVPSSTNAAELKGKHLMFPLEPHSFRPDGCLLDILMKAMRLETTERAHCLLDTAGCNKEAKHWAHRIEKPAGGANV